MIDQPVIQPTVSTDPPVPAGYSPPYLFQYPQRGLQLAGLAVFVLTALAIGYLTWLLHGSPAEVVVSFDLTGLITVIVTILLTVAAHELLHGVVLRLMDYRVQFGFNWRLPGVYAAAFGQFMERNHNLWTTLAPLVVINLLALPLLILPIASVISLAFIVLLINTSGAVGDVYLAYRLLHMPRQTLLYDVSPERMLVFEPKDHCA
ncbi:MAG: DUF3267 domain-containing protein [Anaerolineae bacterium]|nr:DUF3267 domain-containing protein [Anaerolineales bacterium]MCQ3972258.1 DUF3267 domain-containing protein [Anaerolineae bacterium]